MKYNKPITYNTNPITSSRPLRKLGRNLFFSLGVPVENEEPDLYEVNKNPAIPRPKPLIPKEIIPAFIIETPENLAAVAFDPIILFLLPNFV